jgi:hypothetical protein
MKPFRRDGSRGSALLASMIVVTVLSFAAAGILSYSLNTYENSMRQTLLDQAREVADSEMEYIYYGWKNVLMSRTIPVRSVDTSTQMAAYLSTGSGPFMTKYQQPVGQPQWSVSRSITFRPVGPSTGDGSAEGVMSGNLIGKNFYFDAYASAAFTSPILGAVQFKSGRHFAYSSTPLFQYAVFYQGDLELAPGSNMEISGPISTNGSAFLGSQSANGYHLTLTDQVAYFQDYNGALDPLTGTTRFLEGGTTSLSLTDPIYNPNSDPLSTPPTDQAAQRALQVTHMQAQASFIGGVDVQYDTTYPAYEAAYNNPALADSANPLGKADPNEIYRAVIAPPPLASDGSLLTEDPVVKASRMYNTATILITIDATSGSPVVHVGNAAAPTAYDTDTAFASIVTPDSAGAASVLQKPRTQIIDPREYATNNVSGVNLTTLDVNNLKTQLATAMNADATLKAAYNGVLYIYDKTDNSTIAPNTLNGIRVINGATTPDYRDANGNPLGFSVVSNNGLYVQGDYNTAQITVPGVATQVNNPTALMGDAVTALSTNWSMTNQVVTGPHPFNAVVDLANRAPSLPVSDGGVMTINSAILTGNTPSAGTGANPTDYSSGGAQNLVRMIEGWNAAGLTLELDGSLGQLFTSKYFKGHYLSSQATPALLNNNPVYTQPTTRVFSYDTGFRDRAPAGAPTTTAFTRGDFFFW